METSRVSVSSLFRLLAAVVFAAVILSAPLRIGLAASSEPAEQRIMNELLQQQEEIPYCESEGSIVLPGGCNKIQVVVMLDQSNSMQINDRQLLRFYGAENLADLLAHRYLGALTAGMDPPTIELAVLHFGTDAPAQYNSGWMTIAPDSEEAWAAQFEQLKTRISPEELKRRGLNATNFIRPFEAAQALFTQAGSQDEGGCPQRVVLLLTDGAPAGATVLTGQALADHMNRVASIAEASLSGPGNFVYVTAFNVRGDNYWRETRPFWTTITRDSATADPPRSRQEENPPGVASRMERIVATHLGLQSYTIEAGKIVFPPYLQSMRISYYASSPNSSFSLIDPNGNPVVPDGVKVILKGEDEPIKVLDILYPMPGEYQLTAALDDDIISLLPTYIQLVPQLEVTPAPLQQFTTSEIELTLLDSAGNPVVRQDDARYQLDFGAVVRQGDQSWPLSLSEADGTFTGSFLPVSTLLTQVELTAILQDAQGTPCRLRVEPVEGIPVSGVTMQAGEPSGQVCAPSQMPITYPLALVNAETGAPTTISAPVAWDAASSSSSGETVETVVTETEPGQYQLSLRPGQAGDIETALAASAEVEGQNYPFYEDKLFTTGLAQDRRLAFELGEAGTAADRWSLFFNRLFKPWVKDYTGQIVIGRRLFGWLGPTDVTINGRFFDQDTGQKEANIQRFYAQLTPDRGGTPSQKVNAWNPGQGNMSYVSIPAPRLGAYQANITDEGEAVPCTVIGGLPTIGLLLINDFWEYLFWLLLILLALLLLYWLIRTLLCRFVNRPWGRLVLNDPYGQVYWTGLLSHEMREKADRSCFTWKLDPPVQGIHKIRARTWDQPRHWIRVEVHTEEGRQVYRGSLEDWSDINLGGDLYLAWRAAAETVEGPPVAAVKY